MAGSKRKAHTLVSEYTRILCISAHPDDNEFTIAGSVAPWPIPALRFSFPASHLCHKIRAPDVAEFAQPFQKRPCRTRPSCGPSSPTAGARAPRRRLAPPRPRSGSLAAWPDPRGVPLAGARPRPLRLLLDRAPRAGAG